MYLHVHDTSLKSLLKIYVPDKCKDEQSNEDQRENEEKKWDIHPANAKTSGH